MVYMEVRKMAPDVQTTPEGTEFKSSGNRAIFPCAAGGGVALTNEAVSAIVDSPEGGELEEGQISWEWTGDVVDTRVGESKQLKITQTSFGRDRSVTVSLVDVADADAEVHN